MVLRASKRNTASPVPVTDIGRSSLPWHGEATCSPLPSPAVCPRAAGKRLPSTSAGFPLKAHARSKENMLQILAI